MNKKILFLIFTLSVSIVFSQEDMPQKKNILKFSTGYTIGYLKNLSFAPVSKYDYNAVNFQLGYTRTTKRNKLVEFQLGLFDSELETNIIAEPNPRYSKIVLDISSLKRVYNNSNFKIHLGLQSQTNIAAYYKGDYFDAQQKLGIASRFSYAFSDKQSLSSKLTIPIFLFRASSFEDGFYSLGKYQSLLWTTEYNYSLSEHFDITANYNFNYDRLQIFETYRELQHQFNLGINFKF